MRQIRTATLLDVPDMVTLLQKTVSESKWIGQGEKIDSAYLGNWLCENPQAASWQLARDDRDRLLGIQMIGPAPDLPGHICTVATFLEDASKALGIGGALFAATRAAAISLGYLEIEARLRAENHAAEIYYQSRGFRRAQPKSHGECRMLYDLRD